MNRHELPLGLSIFSVLLLLFFGRSVAAGEGKPSWQAEWEKTVTAARQEGRVTIYLSMEATSPIEAGVFQKAYPGIKVSTVATPGGSLVGPRLLAERRAGKYLADVATVSPHTMMDLYRGAALEPVKPALMLPEVTDESRWWQGKHRYTDPEERYVFWYLGVAQAGHISYNKSLVNPREFKSFWDFLNPKWKGKIVANDPRGGGGGTAITRFFYYHPELGPEFLRRLFGEMDLTLSRDRRQQADWLGSGKFALCFFCTTVEVMKAKSQGLPVDLLGFMKEGAGLTAAHGSIGLVNNAPHPNAAKVFVNWYLSRQGQTTLQTELAKKGTQSLNSLRIDIPKDMVPPEVRLRQEVQYLEVEVPGRTDLAPVLKIINEALAEAEKKRKGL